MAYTIMDTDYYSHINNELDMLKGGVMGTRTSSPRIERVLSHIRAADFTLRIINRYSLLTDEMLLDYHENHFVVGILQDYSHRYTYSGSIEHTLRNLGLRSSKAKIMDRLFSPLQGGSYTNQQIIDMCIEHLFGLGFRTIGDDNATHYIHPEIVDEWFIHEETGKYIYNFPGLCKMQHVKNMEQSLHVQISSNDYNYYYHATNWEGGLSILEGINHMAGRKCLDFGLFPSFYIGPSLKDAVGRAERRSLLNKNESAIFVFRIPKEIPGDLNYKSLEGAEWAVVTKKSRMCANNLYNEIKELRRVDLVYGPMVRNVEDVASGNAEPKTHRPTKYQLASKTDKADDFLYEHMVGVLFFQKK